MALKSRDASGRTEAEHLAIVERKSRTRMNTIDALPEEVRTLVHEYGYMVVRACLDIGVTRPKHIRHLVETILDEFSPTRAASKSQGQRYSARQG
jgi:hypothetical protein